FPRSPVVRVAVVIVESRLVLPGYLAVWLVRRGFLDPLLGQVDHERLLARGDRAQPCRGEEHFATGKPLAPLPPHVAGLEVRVGGQGVAYLGDLAVGGEDCVVEHVFNAPQHYRTLFPLGRSSSMSLRKTMSMRASPFDRQCGGGDERLPGACQARIR